MGGATREGERRFGVLGPKSGQRIVYVVTAAIKMEIQRATVAIYGSKLIDSKF